jgi:acetyl esterase/lipase
MKRILRLLLAIPLVASAERELIWPDGKMPDAQPHQIAAMTDVSKKNEFNADEWRHPYIEWFAPPQKPNGCCMILVSGGSYRNCCDVGLIRKWNERLSALGCQCVNFVYRTPWPEGMPFYATAWQDAQRAVRVVRSEAQKRGFSPDRIGVMSMSAGSHLATLMATSSMAPAYGKVDELDETPCNVNLVCAFAPAFVMTDGIGRPNTRQGTAIDAALDDCFEFDGATCPMCLLHGGRDIYSPNGSVEIYRNLHKRKIPAELHIVPDKGHGAHGFERAVEFMRRMGWLGKLKKPVLLASRFTSDESRAVYAKECLWPDGNIPDFDERQTVPYLEWHIPAKLTTKAILVVWSGGAYKGSSTTSFEVEPVRRYLNEKGMAVVTVDYRHPRPKPPLAKHTAAWQDAQRAIRIVKAEAKARGLDPERIGVMGSSAGGHLALMCATTSMSASYWPVDETDKIPCDVQWAVCVYPAYVLSDGVNGPNKRRGDGPGCNIAPEFAFDLSTCPVLFIHGDADGYSSMNSVKAWERMRHMGIQSELHIMAKCAHGFMKSAPPGTGAYNWMDRIWDFLVAKDFIAE